MALLRLNQMPFEKAFPRRGNALPCCGTVIPPHRNAIPPHRNVIPSHRNAIPSHRNGIPSHRNVIPPHRNVIPPHRNVIPPHRNVIPTHRNAIPTHKNTTFSHKSGGFAVIWLLLLVLMSFLPFSTQAQTTSPEFKLKAVYLFNFVQYVEWPENTFANVKSPLIIGVLGNDPFGSTLDDTVKGETVKGRKLEVRRYKNVSEIRECHLLYISNSEAANVTSILARLKGRSILTVSDIEDFALSGGVIRFMKKENKIGFRINTDAARAANLFISAKLLQLAEIISTEK